MIKDDISVIRHNAFTDQSQEWKIVKINFGG